MLKCTLALEFAKERHDWTWQVCWRGYAAGMLARRSVLRGMASGVAAALAPWRALAEPPNCPIPTIRDADVDALRAQVQGTVLSRGSSGFSQATSLYNLRFRSNPVLVVRPIAETDVRAALQWSLQHGVPFGVRSGGHSYIGASATQGLLLDLSSLSEVEALGGGNYRIGPGASLKRIYSRLACDARSIPAGTCDTVGFGGIALGGGVGYLMREHGLTIDRIRSMRVVLADGRIVTASDGSESELFWALRGCGGGNFGIVTSFEVESVQQKPLQQLTWNWSWNDAESAFDRWQRVLVEGALPRHSVSYISLGLGSGAISPTLSAGVISTGSMVDAWAAADLFTGPAGVPPAGAFAWAQLPQPVCNSAEVPAFSRYKAKSAMLYAPMDPSGVQVMRQQLEARVGRSDLPSNNQAWMTFLSLGGAVADVAAGDTAFPHRQALADLQYLAYWPDGSAATAQANLQWMREAYAATFPIVSMGGEGCYANYCDDDLLEADWPRLYYGANLARLRQVKATYDPMDAFRGLQSIRP